MTIARLDIPFGAQVSDGGAFHNAEGSYVPV